MRSWHFLMAWVLLSGCLKDELPVQPMVRGDAQTIELDWGRDYEHQLWFDLESATVVKTTNRFDWHLAFDCRDSVFAVYVNSALFAQAAATGETDFGAVNTSELVYKPDLADLDSTAIGDPRAEPQWWVIDLGVNSLGESLGKRLLWVEVDEEGRYAVEWANLNGNNPQKTFVEKNSAYSRVMLNLTSGEVLNAEAPSADYDLVFTQYTHAFYHPYIPYLVSGVLSNPEVLVAVDSTIPFSEIDRAVAEAAGFEAARDAIGFDWKTYDLEAGVYTVNSARTYLIRDRKGFYYKLRFTGFVGPNGERGWPTVELQGL